MKEQEAIDIYNKGEWKNWTDEQIVQFQLYEDKLCMDWAVFHGAVERVLGHEVLTHEFAQPELLRKEFESLTKL